MENHNKLLLLIRILCGAGIINAAILNVSDADTCNMLCRQCKASAVFTYDHCECNFINNNEDIECIQRVQKEIQDIDLNALSDGLADKERNVRGVLKSRHHLRMEDADKVAQYFIKGGPSAGHSHFLRMFNAASKTSDSTTNSLVDIGYPLLGLHVSRLSLNDPISEDSDDSHMIPRTASSIRPAMPDVKMYIPILGIIKPTLKYSRSRMYDTPNPMVGSIAYPYTFHDTLLSIPIFPAYFLHNLRHQRYIPTHHNILRKNNDKPLEQNVDTSMPGPAPLNSAFGFTQTPHTEQKSAASFSHNRTAGNNDEAGKTDNRSKETINISK